VPAVTDIYNYYTQSASWLQIVSPALAAVAAGAAWRSVFIARRAQVDADQPQLVFTLRWSDPSQPHELPTTLTIENVGRGVAVFPGFVVTSGSGQACSRIAQTTLAHNDRARFGLPFITNDRAMGIVYCEDRHNNVHVWSAQRSYGRYKNTKRQKLTARIMVEALYEGRGDEVDFDHMLPTEPIAD
jgi:hypothetical protein